MRTTLILFMALCGAAMASEPSTFDADKVRQAQERLTAKAASQPSELDQIKKENAELKNLVASLRARVLELSEKIRQTAIDVTEEREKNSPGVWLFTWGSGPSGGPGAKRVRADNEKEAIQKAKAMHIPVFLKFDDDGNEVVYTGMRKLEGEETKK